MRLYVDGNSGTTGLRIVERLSERAEFELLTLPDALRKDASAKAKVFSEADVVITCLPDDAARESFALVEQVRAAGHPVRLLDTSTAHRTAPGWVYGFPELSAEARDAVIRARNLAVPGCHASGFIALVRPLIDSGLLHKDALLSCLSLTGYSGGGKKMIADYESGGRSALLDAPRQYALAQQHKHLKEMAAVGGVSSAPAFCPVVGDFYSGMQVTVPVFARDLHGGPDDVRRIYRELYRGPVVRYVDDASDGGFLSANMLSGKDGMYVSVFGNEDRVLLTAVVNVPVRFSSTLR